MSNYFPDVGDECLFRSEGSLYTEEFVWCKFHGKLINNEGLIIEFIKTSPPLTCVDSFDPETTYFKRQLD